MRMIRSLIYGLIGLSIAAFCISAPAVAATAFTIAAPAVAATPTDPGIYEAIKVSVETPMIKQVYADVVALGCIAPAVEPHSAASRSSVEPSSLNVATAPVTVAAYKHIDPGRAA
jgi:hypothetical protein